MIYTTQFEDCVQFVKGDDYFSMNESDNKIFKVLSEISSHYSRGKYWEKPYSVLLSGAWWAIPLVLTLALFISLVAIIGIHNY